MIPDSVVEEIAQGWIDEFSVDPYVVREREMSAWFKLDDLIGNDPHAALRVFERIAQKDLINWTFEGIAVGPLRSFLMTHGDRYQAEIGLIRSRNSDFDGMHKLAVEGL